MNFLKGEVVRTASDSDELGREYRELLIHSIHSLAVRFPVVADTVILLLLDYLNSDSGVSILSLVKEMLLHQPALVDSVLAKLFEVFSSLEKEDVILSALWIIAEFTPIASLPQAIQTILVLSLFSLHSRTPSVRFLSARTLRSLPRPPLRPSPLPPSCKTEPTRARATSRPTLPPRRPCCRCATCWWSPRSSRARC